MAITNKEIDDKLDMVLEAVSENRRVIGTISVSLTGSLDGKDKGLNARVDLLEGAEDTRRRWVGAGVVAAITSAIGAIIAAISGQG